MLWCLLARTRSGERFAALTPPLFTASPHPYSFYCVPDVHSEIDRFSMVLSAFIKFRKIEVYVRLLTMAFVGTLVLWNPRSIFRSTFLSLPVFGCCSQLRCSAAVQQTCHVLKGGWGVERKPNLELVIGTVIAGPMTRGIGSCSRARAVWPLVSSAARGGSRSMYPSFLMPPKHTDAGFGVCQSFIIVLWVLLATFLVLGFDSAAQNANGSIIKPACFWRIILSSRGTQHMSPCCCAVVSQLVSGV